LLYSPLLKLASGWSVNPSHANAGHAVFTSLTSSSTALSRAIRIVGKIPDIGQQKGPDGLLPPDAIGDSYWHLHT
jgi:hypothetical protein